jgi:transcriptional regulator with XRE-family HTH domain
MISQEHLIFKNDILAERMKKNYSQNQLAKAIGIRRDQLSIIENGHRLPTSEILTKIKEELGCLTDELYSKDLQKIIFKK